LSRVLAQVFTVLRACTVVLRDVTTPMPRAGFFVPVSSPSSGSISLWRADAAVEVPVLHAYRLLYSIFLVRKRIWPSPVRFRYVLSTVTNPPGAGVRCAGPV